MEVKSEKDYLTHFKQSGYRSYHMIIYYTVETVDGPKKIQAEIQIRTMAMNFWATVEHSLQYKYRGDMPPHVADRLSKAAEAIVSLDHEMSSVRSEIMDAQNSSQLQSNLVRDILTNIENLYKISNSREILKIQDEFLRVYKTKDLHQLARFHRELDIIAEGYHAQSVSQRSLS
jgi:putative GTP pyrophosphokinase